MSVQRYPLQAVLEQRAAETKQARLGLAEALRAVERVEEALRRREDERDALTADAEARRGKLYDPDPKGMLEMTLVTRRTDELRYVERRIGEATRAVEEQAALLARARSEVEAARRALVEADREEKAVEKHHEAWLEERRREAVRKEQRQAEEVVTARYAAERTGDERERP